MPHRKNTIKMVEVGTFFKNSPKEALRAIYEVLTAIRITDCGLGLSSFCNAVHKADYLLTDSWFVCDELVKFVSRLKVVKYLLGMAKMGNTKYAVDGKEMTAKQTLNERIWTYICQIISESADFLGLDEEKLMSKFIADNQIFTKLVNLEPLLQAG